MSKEHRPGNNQTLGKQGEEQAARLLERKGYTVLERNWRCRAGEIDLIALEHREGQEPVLVFVEVKTRRGLQYGLPSEAVTRTKQHHLRTAASLYATLHGCSDAAQRHDVVEILVLPEGTFWRHLENAF